MWSRLCSKFRSERGSAILVAVFASIMVLMTAGAAMDLGLYYAKIWRINSVAAVAEDMAVKLRTAYLLNENYGTEIEEQVRRYAEGNGLKPEGLYLDIRIRLLPGSNEVDKKNIDCIFNFRYTDSYDCIFLPLIGINQLPVNVSRNEDVIYGDVPVWQPGDPFEEWTP